MTWDERVLDVVNPDQPVAGLDFFMVLITLLGYIVPYALVGFAVVRPGRRADAFAFWAAVFVTEVIVAVLKILIDRPRPEDVRLLVSLSESPSMPSGHAARAFAGAIALWHMGNKWRVPLLGFAFATVVSRVYVGAHYPSDVVTGAFVGCVVGVAACMGAGWVHRELQRPPSDRTPVFVKFEETALYILRIDYLYSLRLIGELRQDQPRRSAALLLLWGQVRILMPILMILIGIVAFALLLPEYFAPTATCLSTYFIPIVGIELGIPLCIGLGVPAYVVVAAIVYLDMWLSLFLILNFDFLHKVPRLGKWLIRREEKGHEVLRKYPWLIRLEFFGVALVTFTPLPGGGLVPGVLLGRFIGMPRLGVWGAVMLGVMARIGLIVYTVAGLIDRIT